MTVEITITTTLKDIPEWLRATANFTERMEGKGIRTLYVKISSDC